MGTEKIKMERDIVFKNGITFIFKFAYSEIRFQHRFCVVFVAS